LFLGVTALSATIILVTVLVRMRIKLGIIMLSAALLMALFGRFSPITVINTVVISITDPETIRLMLIIIGITALGYLLKATGNLEDIITNLREVISDVRILIALIPALVGLLAVPGGAIMSAPLIEQMGDETGLDRDSLATANIIFRHIYTYTFPMSTGIILISSISGIDVIEFLKFNIPIMIFTIPLAFIYIFRKIKPIKTKKNKAEPEMILRLLISLLPFIIIITMGLVFNIYFPLAIFTGILYVVFSTKTNTGYIDTIKSRLLVAFKGIKWDMVFAIAGVMFFKDIVAVTGFLNEISLFLVDTGIPLFILAILFPLISGLIMGNNSAAIGLSAPLFLSIIPTGINPIPYYNLIYIASSTSYIISPFHLCLVLTTEYYNASLHNVLKQVALVGSWIIVAALIRFAIMV
jgi:hypothetical protein